MRDSSRLTMRRAACTLHLCRLIPRFLAVVCYKVAVSDRELVTDVSIRPNKIKSSIQDGPDEQPTLATTFSRNSFHGRRSGSRVLSAGGTSYKAAGRASRLSKDVRLSITGVPMMPKTTDLVSGPSGSASKAGSLPLV